MNTIFRYIWPALIEEERDNISSIWINYIDQIPEMKEGFVQALVPNMEVFEGIKSFLESKWTVEIIWIWNENWLQYGYESVIDEADIENPITTIVRSLDNDTWLEVTILYPFNIEGYRMGLLNYREFDELWGDVINREYTTEEAREKQVNSFWWRVDRSLI